ncbi:MAG: hypothetical protein HKN04_13830 [Rhodothermaceae bacterium]|nr:hypothetical protein [Rhodothermaceae bacterium]
MRQVLRDIAITTPITFVVTAVVTYLYSLLVHEAGAVNWETAFQLALIFGIVLPLTRARSDAPRS